MVYNEKTYDEIVADITAYIIANTNKINDFNIGSVIRTLIEAYGYELSSEDGNSLYKQLTKVYEGTKIDTATGYDLDQLGSLVGVLRKEGVEASGKVTFMRTTPASSNFSISAGSVVSVQPIQGQDNLRFVVSNTTTFRAQVNNEVHRFYDGIYNYPLSERIIHSVVSMTGTRSGSPVVLTTPDDFNIIDFDDEVVKNDTITLVDDCDSITGWNNTTDTDVPVLDTSDFRQGTASIDIGKSGTSTTVFGLFKTIFTPVDITAKKMLLHLKYDIALSPILNNIEIRIGSSASDYIRWIIDPDEALVDGWNFIKLDTDDASFVGGPVFDILDYVYIGGQVNTTNDTFTQGDLKMDFIILSETDEYKGTLIQFVERLDDDTDFTTSFVPLSVEVDVLAEEKGTEYNVAKDKIVYMISEVSGIVNINNFKDFITGEDIETDASYRDRIRESSTIGGRATVKNIKADIESLDYVKSASVIDMPLKEQTGENIVFIDGTDDYQLTYEVAQNDDFTRVTGYEDELDGSIDDSQVTITLSDASSFPSTGKVLVGGEVMTYTGKSGNDLTGITRGTYGTAQSSHIDGTIVRHWFAPLDDYLISEESKLVFTGVDNPQDTEELSINYRYRWLGHIEIFVSGYTPLTTAQTNELLDKIENEFKGAGVWFTLLSPTNVPVNVIADVHILPGYVFDDVRTNVINTLRTGINSYSIGQNVRVSQLYNMIQSVAGVDYSAISTPASDVIIASDQIANAGTILINQI